jgi:hypothetical protein
MFGFITNLRDADFEVRSTKTTPPRDAISNYEIIPRRAVSQARARRPLEEDKTRGTALHAFQLRLQAETFASLKRRTLAARSFLRNNPHNRADRDRAE